MSSARAWTLAGAAVMGAAALALAPSVARYWSAQLGLGASDRQTDVRALRAAPLEADPEGVPEPVQVPIAESAGGLLRAARPVERAPSQPPPPPVDEVQADAGGGSGDELGIAAVDVAPASEPAAAARLPAGHPVLHDEDPARFPRGVSSAPAPDEEGGPAGDEAPEPAPTRHVSISALEVRTHPGLCKNANAATSARDALVRLFQPLSWGGASLIYLDPRLPRGVDASLVEDLEQAESELDRVLQLTPSRPDVFAYFDTRLLLAGGCTNENVVAYYDGALHVVPSHDDVAQSILHEYTHHALTAAGLLGPAWAHEGIAMHMAGETWWRGGWMERVMERPFALEAMESAVPYKLSADQSGLFYAQSAAMVECATRDDPEGLRGLVESLAAGNDRDQLSYELPPAAAPAAWRSCFSELAR